MAALLVATACAASQRSEDVDPSSSGDGGKSIGAGGSDGAGTAGHGGSNLTLDAGTSAPEPSCRYVDVLFVVDNSSSMNDPQEKLAQAWPSFADAMFDKLPPNVDLHVGITTTSFFAGNCAETTINCATAQTPEEVSSHFVEPSAKSTGENGGQGRLFEYQGKRFFSANTSDADHGPLEAWFAGAATSAGEDGCSYEFSAAAAAYAAAPTNAAHNEGFFRDEEGVLLIVFLTDEPDKSLGEVAEYHQLISGVKQSCGGDACVLVAGLIDPCVQSSNQKLWQLMTAFGEDPIWGDIGGDAASYTQVVGDALAQVVGKTCSEIGVPK